MDLLLALAVLVIVAAIAAAVAAPLFAAPESREQWGRTERLTELEARKEAKYREIRDAEADLGTGKLSREDHRTLDRGLRREAIEILEEMDRLAGEGNGHPAG